MALGSVIQATTGNQGAGAGGAAGADEELGEDGSLARSIFSWVYSRLKTSAQSQLQLEAMGTKDFAELDRSTTSHGRDVMSWVLVCGIDSVS